MYVDYPACSYCKFVVNSDIHEPSWKDVRKENKIELSDYLTNLSIYYR